MNDLEQEALFLVKGYKKFYEQSKNDKEKIKALQEFVIWMTGCGYDFTQHKYFCEQRDLLLKEAGE